jgi:putative pyrroloquinoline-quinone binding quinoprotein
MSGWRFWTFGPPHGIVCASHEEGCVTLEPELAGLPPERVSQIATEVAATLDYGHAQGQVHGDVRPSALQVGPDGSLLLGDASAEPTYPAPERLRDEQVDGRADQYSLACTVFRLLTGRDPDVGADQDTAPSVRESHPWLAPQVDVVLGRAMAADPAHRYASCGEFAAALAASLGPAPQVASPARRGWWIAVAAVVAVAVVAATVVFIVTARSTEDSAGSDVDGITEWDDTLYPQEIESVVRPLGTDELLQDVSGQPEPEWTAPVSDGPYAVGGDENVALVQSGTTLVALDASTGAPLWPAVDLHESPMSCAIRDNRIGCVASASDGSDSSVFFVDAGSGQLLDTVKVPNRDLRWISVAGDRFVATTDLSPQDDKGFAAGYTTEGDEVWTHEGHGEVTAVASQRVVVDASYSDDYSGEAVSFISTEDGREVLRSTRARDGRDLTWNVFHGGIAVQNENWTGTDIYDLDGEKISSIAGWEPIGYQSVYTYPAPIPMLARLKETDYQDDKSIAGVNPKTGHLLWRLSGEELTHQIATVDDKLLVKLDEQTSDPNRRDVIRVYDAYSGKPGSPPINMTGRASVEVYWIRTDGFNLIYPTLNDTQDIAVAYRIETGEKSWELPLAGRAEFPGGAIVAATSEDSISLFG